jgi:hypothetical protein
MRSPPGLPDTGRPVANQPISSRIGLLEDTSETSADVSIGDLNSEDYLDSVLVTSFPCKRRIQNTNVGVAGVLVC